MSEATTKSEVRSQKSEVRSQNYELREETGYGGILLLHFDFLLLTSHELI